MSQIIADRYIILEELGAGGMGTVFKAEDSYTQKTVAIKQLKEGFTDDEMLERFLREGEALRALNHPNIVKMYEAVEEDDTHYLIMELVEGGDLATALKRDRLSLEALLNIAIDLADALTRAHRLQIIHRDLKPANLLLGDNETLKLTDFGIAHIGTKKRITDSLFAVGTIDYMSPETFRGEPVDARTDIWAFGVILFEMLTEERPFQGATITETMYNILQADMPDLEMMAPDAPAALVDLIYRMLERDPLVRIPSVRIVGAELEAIQAGRDVQIASDSLFEEPQVKYSLRQQHNLPAQTSEFVGREDELAELGRLLQDKTQRLITILAPGGMGKTRLALQAAENQLDYFEDGVYFVDLAPLSNPDNIIYTMGDAIGFPLMSNLQLAQKELSDFLGNKHMLLLIDNWEHLIEGASLVTHILQAAPDVTILSTSRRRLEQSGEVLFQLSGLAFPDWETPEDALAYSAVQLFMSSAKRVDPSFELTSDNLDYIARICRLVGGMPLGIVLAASWMGVLSCAEIAEEIANGIEFLESTTNDMPERQRSIQVVFDYSWNLLTPSEQQILMKSSIFKGGFTRKAVQAVTGASLRDLVNLSNKSLLRRDKASGRYSIHELARQFTYNKLEASDEYDVAHNAHLKYFETLLIELAPRLKGGKLQIQSYDILEKNFEDVSLAWTWAHKKQNWDALANLVLAIGFLGNRGRGNDIMALIMPVLQQLLALGEHDDLQERLIATITAHLPLSNNLTSADQERLIQLGIDLAQKHELGFVTGKGIHRLVVYHTEEGQYDIAEKIAQEAVNFAYKIDDLYLIVISLNTREVTRNRQDVPRTTLQYEALLPIARELDNKFLLSTIITNIAINKPYLPIEDLQKRSQLLREALDLSVEIGFVRGIPHYTLFLAIMEVFKINFDTATQLIKDLEAVTSELNAVDVSFSANYVKGLIADYNGDYLEARNYFVSASEARAIYPGETPSWITRAIGMSNIMINQFKIGLSIVKASPVTDNAIDKPVVYMYIIGGLIHIATQREEWERAVELLAVYKSEDPILPIHEQYPYIIQIYETLKNTINTNTFNSAWNRGMSLDLFETVDATLEEYYKLYDVE